MNREDEIMYLEQLLEEFKKDKRSYLKIDVTIDPECKHYELVINIPHNL